MTPMEKVFFAIGLVGSISAAGLGVLYLVTCAVSARGDINALDKRTSRLTDDIRTLARAVAQLETANKDTKE